MVADRVGHYAFILDINEHDIQRYHMIPPSAHFGIEDHVWISSRVFILPGVRIGHHSQDLHSCCAH
jgi:acetyltransferase-like isoleucine patch superfamily enzyme